MEIDAQPKLDGDGGGLSSEYEAVKPFLDQMSVVMATFLASLSTEELVHLTCNCSTPRN